MADKLAKIVNKGGGWKAALVCLLVLAGAATAQQKPVTILAFGDSLTAGFGLQSEDAFPAKLEAALKAKGAAAKVINAGLSGDTTAGGLARLDWALLVKPDFVIVELGGNDALRGVPPAETRANLDAILDKLKARGVRALLAGMLAPPNMGDEYGRAFNAIFPELAQNHGVLLYPFFLEGVATQRDLNLADGIHPNGKGVDIIVDRILPSVLKLIGQ